MDHRVDGHVNVLPIRKLSWSHGSGCRGREKGLVRALSGWESKVTLTMPADIGKLTAAIVYETHPPLRNAIAYTAGDTISYGDLADLVVDVLGKKVQMEVWTVPVLKADLVQVPENPIARYRVVFAQGTGCFFGIREGRSMVRGELRLWMLGAG